MESADPEFTRAMALICWVVENRDEEDAEIFKREAEALLERGLDVIGQ